MALTQKRLEAITQNAGDGFISPSAWRLFVHKMILWAVIFSPLFIAESYGLVTAKSHVPQFLSDFLSSVTNLGWILGVPIISSLIVGGFFCLTGANELVRVAIDDARRAPGTVAAIWFFLGVFFISLEDANGVVAGIILIFMSFLIAFFHFAFWGLTESRDHKQNKVDQDHDQKDHSETNAAIETGIESRDLDDGVPSTQQKEHHGNQEID